jgi:hypothetical protein
VILGTVAAVPLAIAALRSGTDRGLAIAAATLSAIEALLVTAILVLALLS